MAVVEFLVVFVALANCGFALPPLVLQTASPQAEEYSAKAPTQLLQAFGLSQPGVRRWHSEPPQYMLDLYNQVAEPNGLTRLPGPYGATVIRAFSERGGSGSTFFFSINGLEKDELILEAELHVYHSRLQQAHRHLLKDNLYMLEVSAEVEGEHLVLAKHHVAAHSSGWRVFQVGGVVVRVTAAEKFHGEEEKEERHVAFQVIAKTLEGRSLPVVFHRGHQGTRSPLLVLFNTYTPSEDISSLSLFVDKDLNEVSKRKKKYETPALNRLKRSTDNESTTLQPTIPSGCERRDMLVDFASIGWSSWIVSPTSYNAYRCVGLCSFPLGQDLNPTNHATVQSIINHSGNFPQVQRPCCVPSTYGNLSLLYYDAEENVVLKQYDKMVATGCGCH